MYQSGRLSIVATPIGNLGDITVRAISTFTHCDIVLAEDTRVTSKLLTHYEISKPLMTLNEHSTDRDFDKYVGELNAGKHLAFASDAGTPGVSDPGGRFVEYVRQHAPEVVIEALPGASSLTTFLSISGIHAPEGVLFLGFPPHKKGRQTFIREILEQPVGRLVVMFESSHRIERFIREISERDESVNIVIGRELTKKFEEMIFGKPLEVLEILEGDSNKQKGEFVVGVIRQK